MKPERYRLRLLVATWFAGLILILILAGRSNEPRLGGRRLSLWLDQYASNTIPGGSAQKIALREEARRAIRQIGSNAVPALLRMLSQTDSAPMHKLIASFKVRILGLKPARVQNLEAVRGFEVLGADAELAVPALVQIYELNLSESSRSAAAMALGAIGSGARTALPSLVKALSNSNDTTRVYAIHAVGQIQGDPGAVVPPLVRCLSDGNRGIRVVAARALGHFGSNAQEAMPDLAKLLQDPDKSVRRAAEQSIKEISP